MKKIKLFIDNFRVYGLGGIISKIIPLIMVPIVTRIIPNTDYYGISDLSNTVVSFASSIALMGMYDAMYRLFFEKNSENYKRKVCSTAFIITIFTSVISFFIMCIFNVSIAKIFFGNQKYAYIVYISAIATLVGATNSIISAPTRMQNKRRIYLITNTISPLLAYTIAIPMLLKGYYIIALPLAAMISSAIMEITFWSLNHEWFSIKLFDRKLLMQLLVIAVPLMPNFLVYWLFNSCDKVMITNMLGIGAAGIYSVGSKLGNCSQLIYIAFAGGWQYFAFSTMKDNDQVKTNSKIFEYLGIVSFIVTAFVCAWSYFIFKLLFTKQYMNGYIVAPYLFLAPLLQMLFQVSANQFLIIKKTWPSMLILFVGAIVNIIMNSCLIPILKIEGAAIATLLGYIATDLVCVLALCKMKLMIITKRFICAVVVMIIYMLGWRFVFWDKIVIGTFAAIGLGVIICLMYKKEIMSFINHSKARKESNAI